MRDPQVFDAIVTEVSLISFFEEKRSEALG
jgi:hypothetical protein